MLTDDHYVLSKHNYLDMNQVYKDKGYPNIL
jgi:hypothetical protein